MSFEPDFRAPNSNESVLGAAVAALIIVALVWLAAEALGHSPATQAAAASASITGTRQPCAWRPDAPVAYDCPDEAVEQGGD